ncbi:MAG: hypothetical protein ACK4VW_07345, partial [Anaerolineales bacterium]
PPPPTQPTPTPERNSWIGTKGRPTLRTWSISLLWLILLASGNLWLRRKFDLRHRLRIALYLLCGGLGAYGIGILTNLQNRSFSTLSSWLALVTVGAILGLSFEWLREFFAQDKHHAGTER